MLQVSSVCKACGWIAWPWQLGLGRFLDNTPWIYPQNIVPWAETQKVNWHIDQSNQEIFSLIPDLWVISSILLLRSAKDLHVVMSFCSPAQYNAHIISTPITIPNPPQNKHINKPTNQPITHTSVGVISSILLMRSVKNSVMSFCSAVFSGCLSMV